MEKPNRLPLTKTALFFLLFFLLSVLPLAARDADSDRTFPYSLGVGIESNLNTREGAAMGYGAVLDRYFIYSGDRGILRAGLKFAMQTDFAGITGTEASLFARLNLVRLGPGDIFTQIGFGFGSYREDEITANTMLSEFTVGYRFYFLGGFYVEPYLRTGFPFLLGGGVMAGHWFSF